MSRKKYSPEQIIIHLREVEVLCSQENRGYRADLLPLLKTIRGHDHIISSIISVIYVGLIVVSVLLWLLF